MATKTPTPQGISALLAKAGYVRAEFTKGRLSRSGFRARKDYGDGAIIVVEYYALSHSGRGLREQQSLDRYAEALRAAGWHVRQDHMHRLIVTAGD